MPKEPDTPFISELTRAATDIAQLTRMQCARLLQRAAATLSRDYQYRIDYAKTPANSRLRRGSVYKWSEMPLVIDRLSDEEVSSELLHAASLVKAAQGKHAKPEGSP